MTARQQADWVLIERAVAGRATAAELAELGPDGLHQAVARLTRQGLAASEIAERLDIPERRVTRIRGRLKAQQEARPTR